MEARRREVKRLPHHEQDNLCTTRASYRQGRQLTAVKVYTVNDESQHLIISGVPSLGLQDELRRLCFRFGDVKSLVYIPNYSSENFVEAYHVHFSRIQSARHAKRHIDGRAFFGGSLHVCYAPEMESISETRTKLILRRHEVTRRSLINESRSSVMSDAGSISHTCLSQRGCGYKTEGGSSQNRCIWNEKEMCSDPRLLTPAKELERASSSIYGPRPSAVDWSEFGVREVTLTPLTQKSSSSKQHPKKLSLQSSVTVPRTINKPKTPPARQATTIPPILKLVPSQIKSAQKKIIFHPKPKIDSVVPSGDKSLDSTIMSVREKIRAVTVPSIKIMLDKNYEVF
ncbi:RNA-binding protein 48 [Frankliniella fusca]|uniref:RNA-binding protein 48 n=1 Tax=Frankliniella fusca TaxID=407009 RepID=A0AAE1HC75_9NEOP|nr:RNA-binding protein 48 [Frankliniella fusca]